VTGDIGPAPALPPGVEPPAQPSIRRGSASGGIFEAALAEAQKAAGAPPSSTPAPPPELGAKIAAAASAWDALSAAGQYVAFHYGEDGEVSIELQDEDGRPLQSLSGSDLFSLIDERGGE
jgi:hypothetical protein